MFSFRAKSNDLRRLAAEAEAAAGGGRHAEAEKLMRQIVLLEAEIEKSPAPEAEKQADRRILAQAFLDLGEMCQKKSAAGEALAHYGKARYLGAALSPAAWALLAETYAAQGASSGYALGAYFAYIQQHPPGEASAPVYAALEAVCRVDENTVSESRKRAAEINRRVIAVNGALEWPYYYLAVAHLQDGDLPSAMIHLMRAQKRNPSRAMTYYWMGACHLRQSSGTLDSAVEWFDKFLAFPPDDPQIAELQAGAAFELGKRLIGKGDAIRYLEIAAARGEAQAGQPGEVHQLLARLCLEAGRYADAETHSRAAMDARGREPALLGCLLRALDGQEKRVEALEEWERSPLLDAGEDAVFCVARAYARLGRFESARQWLERLPRRDRVEYYEGCALANLGRLEEARARWRNVGAGEYACKALAQIGAIALRAGDLAEAGDAYDRALALDPEDSAALFGMGSLAQRMGEVEIAADCFSKILTREPGHVRARFAMGAVHEARGQTSEAIACYEAVRKPLEARVRLGVCYCRDGQYQKAAEALESLYGSTMESDAVLYYLSLSLAALDRGAEALEIWSKLAARHPEDRSLETGMADLYLGEALRHWESREAEALLDQALVHDPRHTKARYYRALQDWKRGRAAEAEGRLRELASDGGAADARALYHLGVCLALNGKAGEASPYFERAARDRSSDYGRYAAWALANEHIGQGRYAEAEAILAGIV